MQQSNFFYFYFNLNIQSCWQFHTCRRDTHYYAYFLNSNSYLTFKPYILFCLLLISVNVSLTSMFTWNAFILTKQTITSCSVTEKFRKVNFPSHDLNHPRSLIVLWTKVKKIAILKIWIFTRTSMPRLRQNDRERAVDMIQAGMTHQAVADHFNMSRITISRLMIRLRQTGSTNDRPLNGRPRVTSQRQDRHLPLIQLRNRMIRLRTLPLEHLV